MPSSTASKLPLRSSGTAFSLTSSLRISAARHSQQTMVVVHEVPALSCRQMRTKCTDSGARAAGEIDDVDGVERFEPTRPPRRARSDCAPASHSFPARPATRPRSRSCELFQCGGEDRAGLLPGGQLRAASDAAVRQATAQIGVSDDAAQGFRQRDPRRRGPPASRLLAERCPGWLLPLVPITGRPRDNASA